MEQITWTIDRVGDRNIMTSIFERQYDNIINQLIMNETDFEDEEFIPFIFEPDINKITADFFVSEEDKNCCICMESREENEICKLNCQHKFCGDCVNKLIQKNTSMEICCPMCRENINCVTYKK